MPSFTGGVRRRRALFFFLRFLQIFLLYEPYIVTYIIHTSFDPHFTSGSRYYSSGFSGDLGNLHLNGETLTQTGVYAEKITCGSGLLIMHLFAKQINRRITQTNISHRTASVNRPFPEEKGGKRRKTEKVCLLLLPQPAISILLKHAIPQRKYNLFQAHTQPPPPRHPPPPLPPPPHTETVGNAEPGNLGSYE